VEHIEIGEKPSPPPQPGPDPSSIPSSALAPYGDRLLLPPSSLRWARLSRGFRA
jgi:hypothetical protein